MAKDRKVIPFTGKYKKALTRTTPNDLRAAATGTLGFILLLMIGLNFSLFETKTFDQDSLNKNVRRGIASVPKVFEPQWKRNISGEAESIHLKPARKPSPLDNLNFGLLEGKYSVHIEKGHVVNINFSESTDVNPTPLSDRAQFIKEYSPVFISEFQSAAKIGSEQVGNGYKETYRVKSKKGESIFEFHLDQNNRLMSLSVK